MLLRVAIAGVWVLKPFFDLVVLLLTIFKSSKFKQAPRPVLVDILILDGMDLNTTQLFGARLTWLCRDSVLRVRRSHSRLINPIDLEYRASIFLSTFSICFSLVSFLPSYPLNNRSQRCSSSTVGTCTLHLILWNSPCSPRTTSLSCDRSAHR